RRYTAAWSATGTDSCGTRRSCPTPRSSTRRAGGCAARSPAARGSAPAASATAAALRARAGPGRAAARARRRGAGDGSAGRCGGRGPPQRPAGARRGSSASSFGEEAVHLRGRRIRCVLGWGAAEDVAEQRVDRLRALDLAPGRGDRDGLPALGHLGGEHLGELVTGSDHLVERLGGAG